MIKWKRIKKGLRADCAVGILYDSDYLILLYICGNQCTLGITGKWMKNHPNLRSTIPFLHSDIYIFALYTVFIVIKDQRFHARG